MLCPKCHSQDSKVLDTRSQKGGESIRRRRECESCTIRFTTIESVVRQLPMIIKKDGRREPFSRDKILFGLKAACQKRPVSLARIDHLVENIENWALEMGDKEVASTVIGQFVMNEVRHLDEVAYIRFASVYKTFRDVNEFVEDIKIQLENNDPSPSQQVNL